MAVNLAISYTLPIDSGSTDTELAESKLERIITMKPTELGASLLFTPDTYPLYNLVFDKRNSADLVFDAWAGLAAAWDVKAEAEYQKIGVWNGPHANAQMASRQRDWWHDQGARGVFWLVERAIAENDLEVQFRVAGILSDEADIALPAVLGKLARLNSVAATVGLLTALGWIPPISRTDLARRAKALIATHLVQQNVDVRDAAISATRCLSAPDAIELLAVRLKVESDKLLRDSIVEAIAERQI